MSPEPLKLQTRRKVEKYQISYQVPEGYNYTIIVDVLNDLVETIPFQLSEWRGKKFSALTKTLKQQNLPNFKVTLISPKDFKKKESRKKAPGVWS